MLFIGFANEDMFDRLDLYGNFNLTDEGRKKKQLLESSTNIQPFKINE